MSYAGRLVGWLVGWSIGWVNFVMRILSNLVPDKTAAYGDSVDPPLALELGSLRLHR